MKSNLVRISFSILFIQFRIRHEIVNEFYFFYTMLSKVKYDMWDMYLGLDLAWRENTTHLIKESDSKILVDMTTENCNFGRTTPTLVKRIRQLLSLSWTIKITHIWREGNKSAD